MQALQTAQQKIWQARADVIVFKSGVPRTGGG